MAAHSDPRIFALHADAALADSVSGLLEVPLSRQEEREFEDGEHKIRPLESVRGRDVYILAGLYADARHGVGEKLIRLLFFVGALKDAAAGSVTVVAPYLCYARKDRKTKPRDPVTTRYVASLLEAIGVDRVVTLDVHNLAAFQNAFRCRTEHLEARPLFAEHVRSMIGPHPVTVVSPDVGGVKRADALRRSLEKALGRPVGGAFMEKWRSGGAVGGETLVGSVGGGVAVILDDLISTGTTIIRAAEACRAAGAAQVHALATHGLFAGGAPILFQSAALDGIVVTNSVPPSLHLSSESLSRLAVLDVAPLLADAIGRLHGGGSLVALADEG